jgi:hypothetical protein
MLLTNCWLISYWIWMCHQIDIDSSTPSQSLVHVWLNLDKNLITFGARVSFITSNENCCPCSQQSPRNSMNNLIKFAPLFLTNSWLIAYWIWIYNRMETGLPAPNQFLVHLLMNLNVNSDRNSRPCSEPNFLLNLNVTSHWNRPSCFEPIPGSFLIEVDVNCDGNRPPWSRTNSWLMSYLECSLPAPSHFLIHFFLNSNIWSNGKWPPCSEPIPGSLLIEFEYRYITYRPTCSESIPGSFLEFEYII